MMDDTTLGRVVLGLDGFRLVRAELVGGEVCLHAETTAVRVGCPDCGVLVSRTAAGPWCYGTCRWRAVRAGWCGTSGCGDAASRRVAGARGPNGVMTSRGRDSA